MTSSSTKFLHVFRIQFPIKSIFWIFKIWKTNRITLFCNLFIGRISCIACNFWSSGVSMCSNLWFNYSCCLCSRWSHSIYKQTIKLYNAINCRSLQTTGHHRCINSTVCASSPNYGRFATMTFRPQDVSPLAWTFRPQDVSYSRRFATWTLRPQDVSYSRRFTPRTFLHLDISPPARLAFGRFAPSLDVLPRTKIANVSPTARAFRPYFWRLMVITTLTKN